MGGVWGSVFAPGLFTYTFMVHAWVALLAVAVAAPVVGYFVVLRGAAFMAHAIPQSAFMGAALAVLVGASPLVGVGAATLATAAGLAVLDRPQRPGASGAVVAMVLVLSLGLGNLFLALSNAYAGEVYALLFGQLVGVSAGEAWLSVMLMVVLLGTVAYVYRPLLLTSVLPESAEARGVRLMPVNLVFALLLALAATMTVPVVGSLLSFSLLVGPAATASRLTAHPARLLGGAVALAVVTVAVALVLAYDTGAPIGFVVTALTALSYVAASALGRWPHGGERAADARGA
jgi:zinc/manganese transport system permease protein